MVDIKTKQTQLLILKKNKKKKPTTNQKLQKKEHRQISIAWKVENKFKLKK